MASNPFIHQYGCLVQYGFNFMEGFSAFADEFIARHKASEAKKKEQGFCPNLESWIYNNQTAITQLYGELLSAGLLPQSPFSP